MELFSLIGRKAIVTGAATGLGKAIAEGLQLAGAEVVIIDVRNDVNQIAASMSKNGPIMHGVQADLSDRHELIRAFKESIALLGNRLDILVNNAGIVIRHTCEEFPMEDWDKVMEINLNAVFQLSQLAARVMILKEKAKSSMWPLC